MDPGKITPASKSSGNCPGAREMGPPRCFPAMEASIGLGIHTARRPSRCICTDPGWARWTVATTTPRGTTFAPGWRIGQTNSGSVGAVEEVTVSKGGESHGRDQRCE
jgi:hypothetical protein